MIEYIWYFILFIVAIVVLTMTIALCRIILAGAEKEITKLKRDDRR